jgi:protocatechuate 3,4-dioxygenase beta subunit
MPETDPIRDIPTLPTRRGALGSLSALGVASLFGCGGGSGASGTASEATTSSADSSDATGTETTSTALAARKRRSSATLSALSLSSGTLSPSFSSSTTSYTASVTNATASITVTVSASGGAAISVNGSKVASGASSGSIALAVGTTTIAIVVTSADASASSSYSVAVTRASASSGSNCAVIPSETQGPFPLLAILSNSAMVRQDITESKTGVPLTLTLTLEDVNNACAPIAGAAVYIWHCDKDGEYSGYSSNTNGNHLGETFLRGIQLSDANGQVTFTTIFPGWYAGRITHIHLQVYLNDNLAVTATATSQLAFPQTVTAAVYASSLYAARGQNTSVTSFAADNVFSDGTTYQMASVSGSVASGLVASLNVGIAA